MKIIEINSKEILNKYLVSQSHSESLQSFEWGEFQEQSGFKLFRLGVEENGELMAVATLIKKTLGFGKSYFYCPRGPVANDEFKNSNLESIFNFLMKEVQKIAYKENAIFLRFEPESKILNLKSKIYKTIDLQPAKTSILDLSRTEDELLSAMHHKTRYNIRLAEKKGVVVREAGLEEFDKFWKLMEATKDRDGFRLHSKSYYQKMLDCLSGKEAPVKSVSEKYPHEAVLSSEKTKGGREAEVLQIKLFFAEYENKILAAGLFAFFGNTAVYMHGASANELRNIMAPYLLQWTAIKEAKKAGYGYYDFFGIDEAKWPGVTRFKLGFGGEEKKYPGTYDYAFKQTWYAGYKLLRRIRRYF